MKAKRKWMFGFILLWIAVILISWFAIPAWHEVEGGFWVLVSKASIAYIALVAALIEIAEKFGWFSNTAEPTNQALAQGESSQAVAGEKARAIHVEGQGKYIEHVEKYIEASPPPSAKGFIRTAHSTVYIHRGEIEDKVRNALRSNGVAAIVGLHAPGGLGKTELAIQAARDLKEEQGFEKILWVDMGESTPEEVMARFLRICGLKAQPNDTYAIKRDLLQGFLQSQHLLVVLDDVRKVNASHLADFLPPSPPCSALVTSRINSFSAISAKKIFSLDKMNAEEARELFEAHLSKDILEAEEEALTALFRRCRFNPLALEISARRIADLLAFNRPIARFLAKIEKSLQALRVEDDENLNLFAVFDASYKELDPTDQKAFAELAVFHPGGFAPEAVAFLWGLSAEESSQRIARFLRLSLLKTVPGDFERYRLHDLLDEYAASILGRERESTVRKRHAEWLSKLFEQYYTDDPSTAPHVLLEMDNLRFALAWAEKDKDGDLLAALLNQARNWLMILSLHNEQGDWLESALALGISDKKLEANTRQAIGDVRQFRKELDSALESYNSALALFQKVGDQLGEANTRQAIGDVRQFRSEYDSALESYNSALALFQKVGDQLGEANTRAAMARLILQKGDLKRAMTEMEKVIPMRKAIGDIYGEGADYGNFAIALLNNGHKKEAKDNAEKARPIFEKLKMDHALEMINQIISACEA